MSLASTSTSTSTSTRAQLPDTRKEAPAQAPDHAGDDDGERWQPSITTVRVRGSGFHSTVLYCSKQQLENVLLAATQAQAYFAEAEAARVAALAARSARSRPGRA